MNFQPGTISRYPYLATFSLKKHPPLLRRYSFGEKLKSHLYILLRKQFSAAAERDLDGILDDVLCRKYFSELIDNKTERRKRLCSF
jgi:hypothetical protein